MYTCTGWKADKSRVCLCIPVQQVEVAATTKLYLMRHTNKEEKNDGGKQGSGKTIPIIFLLLL